MSTFFTRLLHESFKWLWNSITKHDTRFCRKPNSMGPTSIGSTYSPGIVGPKESIPGISTSFGMLSMNSVSNVRTRTQFILKRTIRPITSHILLYLRLEGSSWSRIMARFFQVPTAAMHLLALTRMLFLLFSVGIPIPTSFHSVHIRLHFIREWAQGWPITCFHRLLNFH